MKLFFIFLLFVCSILGDDRLDLIVKHSYGALSKKELLSHKRDILKFLSYDEKKVDKLLSQSLHLNSYLKFLIKKSKLNNQTLNSIFQVEEKKRELLLNKLSLLEKENGDKNFIIVMNKAKRALKNFDYENYHKILDSYIENKKNLEILKNMESVKYLKVMEFYNRTLYSKTKEEIQKSLIGREDSDYLLEYGRILYKISEYDMALELFFRYLDLKAEIQNQITTARTYKNIGLIYTKKGEYDKAIEYYFKDLKIELRNHGEYHHTIATIYNNIGMVYYKMGNYDESIEYIKKALFIYETTLGPEHKYTKSIIEAFDIVSEKLVGTGKY